MIPKLLIVLSIIIAALPGKSFGIWLDPKVIVKGTWGPAENQFGITLQDTSDFVPIFENVTTEGKLVIRDGANSRVKIYNGEGKLELLIPYYGVDHDYRDLKIADSYGFSGDFVGNGTNGVNYFYRADQQVYIYFSSTGEIIKTTKEWPAELGIVNRQKSDGANRVTIVFPNKTYKLFRNGLYEAYRQDLNGNLNAISGKQITKLDKCGNEIGAITIPENKYKVTRRGGQEVDEVIDAEYGPPVAALNGDIYTWKRTQTDFSILKWSWVDDKNKSNTPCEEMNMVPNKLKKPDARN